MKNNKMIWVTVAIVAVTIAAITFGTQSSRSQSSAQTQKDSPTVVELNRYTEQQRKHSKLYIHPEEQSGKNLVLPGKDLDVVITAPWRDVSSDADSRLSQEAFVQQMLCSSDFVVQAKVGSKSSQLTEDHRFVFTDYILEVEDVVKSLNGQHEDLTKTITLTTPGGAVKANGKTINLKVKSVKRLEIGDSYVLFLAYLPESESFKTVTEEGVFEVNSDKVARFSDISAPYKTKTQSRTDFVNFVGTTAPICSKG